MKKGQIRGARDRATLHLAKVDEFAAWARGEGWVREPTKGPYEVLRLFNERTGAEPLIFHRREGTAHATIHQTEASKLVRRWIRSKRVAHLPSLFTLHAECHVCGRSVDRDLSALQAVSAAFNLREVERNKVRALLAEAGCPHVNDPRHVTIEERKEK